MKLFIKQLAQVPNSLSSYSTRLPAASLLLLMSMNAALPVSLASDAIGIGVVGPVPSSPVRAGVVAPRKKTVKPHQTEHKKGISSKTSAKKPDKKPAQKQKVAAPVRPPQQEVNNVSKVTLAPGVVLKRHRGVLNINILDVDLKTSTIEVKPVLASDTFNRLDEVRDQAAKVKAIAAVNANYFKKDGTPLGTLIIDSEWMAGPLFDRISMGFTSNGNVFIDNPRLHGILETSNPSVPNIWVNNVNQPRRSGARVILYTRRWGSSVKLPYAGTLVAVDASGKVIDKSLQVMNIPYNGYVLSDSRKSEIAQLHVGDVVNLAWHPKPDRWNDVVHAISGGPCLIRHGNLFVNLQGEHFRKNWTSNTIHARTAAGITKDKHLIMVTVEGKHTLWEVAKLLKELGCVDAMNLDGGGSTTMVVNGDILTRNRNSYQRRVAATLAVLPRSVSVARKQSPLSANSNLTDLDALPELVQEAALADPFTNVLTKDSIEAKAAAQAAVEPSLAPDVIPTPAAAEAQSSDEPKLKGKQKKRKFQWFHQENKPEACTSSVKPVSQTETSSKSPESQSSAESKKPGGWWKHILK